MGKEGTEINIIKFTFVRADHVSWPKEKKKWRPLFNFRVSRRNAPTNGIEVSANWGLFTPASSFDKVSFTMVYKQILAWVSFWTDLF